MKPHFGICRGVAAALIIFLLAFRQAGAEPVLIVSDGVSSSGPITLSGGAGFINTNFDGTWSVVVASGQSKPGLGSASSPDMELDVIATSLGSTNPLTVIFSDNNFGPTSGHNNFLGQIIGQPTSGSGDVVTFNTYYDSGNTLGALTTPLTASGGLVPDGSDEYFSDKTNSLSLTGPYSLTEVVHIAGGQAAGYSLLASFQSAIPVLTPPADAFACPDGTATFSIAAEGTNLFYQWFQGLTLLNGQTNNTLVLTNVTDVDAGVYSVVVSNSFGSVITNSATLTVYPGILVTMPPMNSTNCAGTTANFSINASGADLTYQWYYRGLELSDTNSALTGETNSTLTLLNVTYANLGTYSVVVNGTCGTVTNSAMLVVFGPTLASIPMNSTNCPGTTAYFSVNAPGRDVTYQWYFGTNLLSNQTNSTLTLSNVTSSDAGIYIVAVNGICGGETNNAYLFVNQDVSVAPLPNVTNLIGSSAVFTAVASGTGPFTYQWYQGGNPLAGQTNSTLALSNLQPTNAGAYSVSVYGQCGPAATSGFVLTIHLPPVVNICYPTNGQVFVAPATFDVMARASDPDGTVTNVQFFSSTNGVDQIFLGQTNNTPYLTIASNLPVGIYALTATAVDNFGATGQSAPVTVKIVPPEPPDVTVVGHMTLNLQDGYQWLSNVVCNPVESYAQAARVYIGNITNSAIQVVNATGTNNGVPYIESPAAIQPGTCWTNVIMFYDPVQVAFYPTLTVELVPPPNAAGNPTGTVVPMLPAKMLANGTFLIEFASTNGATYYVQYSSDMVNWSTSLPAITGDGQHMQWIDSGPPATASLPAANVTRFYRVIEGE